jgi:hypothetical protein
LYLAGACLGVLAVLGVVARIVLPDMLGTAVNRLFPPGLTSPAQVKSLRIGLLRGRATVQGLTVSQPDGFGGDRLLDLPAVTVTMAVWSALGSSLTIEEVRITGATLHVVRDPDGKVNTACFRRPPPRRPVHIAKIIATNCTVHYTDFNLGAEPVAAQVNHLDVVVTDLHLGPVRSREPALPGRVAATAQAVQPGFADALLGVVARFGYLDAGSSRLAANAAIRLAGLELAPLASLAPRGAAQAMGGDVVDVHADVAVSATLLTGAVTVSTAVGETFSLPISGTPRQPLVGAVSLRSLLRDRAAEAGWNTLGRVAGTGEELGRASLASATSAGVGAGKMLWGVATGLFQVATRVSEGNMTAAGSGLLDTASATVTDTADTLGDTGADLATGARKTGAAAFGGDRSQAWRADTFQRWARSWQEACGGIDQRPFPPSVPPVARQACVSGAVRPSPP